MLLTANEAAALKNPDRIRRWSLKYFYRTQSKTIFDETYTGTTMTKDGPKKTETIVGAPILLITDLKDTAGMVVNYTMINPLFQDSESRLRYAKVKGERREGSEKSLSKMHVKFPIAEAFWGIKEEDVNPGKKDIGMFNLMTLMTKGMSDNNVQYLDDDTLEGGFLLGHSRHLYTTVGKAAAAADGSAVEAVAEGVKDYGISALPTEHPNTLVWNGGKLVRPATAETGNFVTQINKSIAKITTADRPGLTFVNAVSLEIKRRKMVGIRYIGGLMGDRTLFKVLVDPILMTQLREDFSADGKGIGNILSNAYQTKGDEHPLIRQGGIIWGNLYIHEEEKLLEGAFSNKYSFDALAQNGDAGTKMTFARVANEVDYDLTLVKANRVVDVSTSVANSIFENSGTAAATATTEALDGLANVIVLGGNAIGRIPGPVTRLIPRTDNDYERILGLGNTNIFGHKRLDFTDALGGSIVNQSSFRVVLWRGL